MSDADIAELRKNDLCVVIAKEPSLVKFIDQIPAQSFRTQMDDAAIKLSRTLLSRAWGWHSNSGTIGHSDFATMYVKLLTEGSNLDDQFMRDKQNAYRSTLIDEQRKIAREDARAERAAQKPKDQTK